MPDTHDYPLAEVLGSGDLIHQARPAVLFGSRIETRCGMEGNKTGRDGGAWCPECVALEQAEVDADDKSSTFRNDLRTQLVTAGTEAAEQWLAVRANRKMSDVNRRRLAGHVVNALWTEIERAVLEMAPYFGGDERGGDEAAEVVGLLRSLPRTKITPENITQHMIDRWYREKGEYLGTIRGLREELDAANEHAQTAHDQVAELGAVVVALRSAANAPRPLPSITAGISDVEAEASATFDLTIDEVRTLKADLDAATARAESATVLPERWRALIAERDAANERAEKAERASRLLVVGQNELDRQWAETDAATRAEFEEWMNEQRERTEKAERQRDVAIALGNRRKWQRDEARALMYRIIGAIEHAYALNTYVELEPGEEAPTIESLWAEVREVRGVAADALVGTEGGSSPRTLPSGATTEYRYVLADGRESEFELHNEGPCGCRREQRPVYVGDWRPAPDAASADWTDYGDGWSSRRPDASLDGLRGPFTGLLGPLGISTDAAPSGRSRYGLVPPRPTSDMILTPDEWCRAYGVTVHDPDGWRGKDESLWDDPITLAEFSLRANQSTIDAANPAWDGVARDVRLCASESASEPTEPEKP